MLSSDSLLAVYFIIMFLCFEAFALIGIWGLSLNIKSHLNRLFFVICYAFTVWSIALALSTGAPDRETALFWRRFGTLGWGAVYSCILHYFLIMTGQIKLLSRVRTYLFLYLPVLVNYSVFCFIGRISRSQFFLVESDLGWINIPPDGIWDSFFNVYYIGYSLLSLVLLGVWGGKSRESRRHSVLFILSFLAAFVMGSATDILMNRFVQMTFPAMAPVFIMLPVLVFSRGIKWYGIASPLVSKNSVSAEEILSEKEQLKIYTYIGLAFIFLSLLYFILYFANTGEIYSVLINGSGLFFMGFTILLLRHIPLVSLKRDLIMTVLVGISLLAIMFYHVSFTGNKFIWTIPLLFMILSGIFNRPQLLYTIIGVSLGMQLWNWFHSPDGYYQISSIDHLIRLGILILGAVLTVYVRKIYLKRLKALDAQIKWQRALSGISTHLASVSVENMDWRLQGILNQLGKLFPAHFSVLITLTGGEENDSELYTWNRGAPEDGRVFFKDLELDIECSLSALQFEEGDFLYVPDISKAENLAPEFQTRVLKAGQKTVIATHLKSGERCLGSLCLFCPVPPEDSIIEIRRIFAMIRFLLTEVLLKIESERKINDMAYFDHLTGLPNRVLFDDRAGKALSLAERTNKLVAVMMLDLDSFKAVNDTMGHDAGDTLLKIVAEKLSSCIRDYDTVSRFGGDEFLFILSQLDTAEDTEIVADKLMTILAEPIVINHQRLYITASIGIAIFPHDGETPQALTKNADMAMYSSKRRGRNQYSFCSSVMKESLKEELELTTDLPRALENNELYLLYQPQVETRNCRITGVEALIRWRHPEKGVISPAVFIPLAEESGHIHSIGLWVLDTACAEGGKIHRETGNGIRIAVNLSIKQLVSKDFPCFVQDALKKHNFPPHLLELEITESVAMLDSNEVNSMLARLKQIGVSLSIDDFGTQYSSLTRIKNLPIDRLKIDKEFIDELAGSDKKNAIAVFIVDLSKNLGLEVIAEGVENHHQYAYLLDKECDEIQGFYFSKPVPIEEIRGILKKGMMIPVTKE